VHRPIWGAPEPLQASAFCCVSPIGPVFAVCVRAIRTLPRSRPVDPDVMTSDHPRKVAARDISSQCEQALQERTAGPAARWPGRPPKPASSAMRGKGVHTLRLDAPGDLETSGRPVPPGWHAAPPTQLVSWIALPWLGRPAGAGLTRAGLAIAVIPSRCSQAVEYRPSRGLSLTGPDCETMNIRAIAPAIIESTS
jgi:hypothetical protein